MLMRYAGIVRNDLAAAPGISVSFFVQGCPHRCPGCHNPETWDFNGGREFDYETIKEILTAIKANNIERSFSVLGGEPLCQENLFLTLLVLTEVKKQFPQIKTYLWTGYYYEDLLKNKNSHLSEILQLVDVLIDGPYIESKRDTTLPLRGSTNQSIINLKEIRDGKES